MIDFLAAIGLVFAIEGLLLAAFPLMAKQAMKVTMEMPNGSLRITGILSALVGVLIVWLARG
jgi:uncharacterized protein